MMPHAPDRFSTPLGCTARRKPSVAAMRRATVRALGSPSTEPAAQARGAPPDAPHEISVPDLVSGRGAGAWREFQRLDRDLSAVERAGPAHLARGALLRCFERRRREADRRHTELRPPVLQSRWCSLTPKLTCGRFNNGERSELPRTTVRCSAS